MPDPTEPPFPARLGSYELLRRLTTGGMAEIFLARTRGSQASAEGATGGFAGFERIVVVKRMLPALASQPDFVAMFMDEARLAAAMHHPNIVQTFDVGHEGTDYFMAMEYLHGEDLRTLFRALRAQSRRMPLDQVAHVISHVCAGLQYAHDRIGSDGNPLQIVHRDVSPQNVVVTFDGAVKLLDFGIAKAEGRFGETRWGTLKGKIGYMSPEQCRGEPLDRRSDVFTAAILLYELSTGRRLFRGASEYEVLKRIVEEEVPSPRLVVAAHGDGGDYPEELERIVLKGLARDPAARYASARELAEDLETFAREARLATSPLALGRFMERTFGTKVEAWREAQRQGKDLAQHLVELTEEAELPDPVDGPGDGPGDGPEGALDDGEGGRVRARVNDTPSARPKTASAPHRLVAADKGAASPPPPPPTGASRGRPPTGPTRRPTGAMPLLVAQQRELLQQPPAPLPTTPPNRLSRTAMLAIFASVALLSIAAGGVAAHFSVPPPRQAAVSPAATMIVEVETAPAGASVFLDGRAAPAGAPARFEGVDATLAHLVVAELPGHHPAVRHVEPQPGAQLRVTLALDPIAPTAPVAPSTPGPPGDGP